MNIPILIGTMVNFSIYLIATYVFYILSEQGEKHGTTEKPRRS